MSFWRLAGECSWPVPENLKTLSINGINPFRYSWSSAGYSIVVPNPKDPARSHHVRVCRLYTEPVPIHEQTAVTFAVGVISDSTYTFYFPSTPDVDGAFEAGIPRYEGFWRRTCNEESDLPWPEAQPGWANASEFLSALKHAEGVAERVICRGLSRCRLCGRTNGDSSFRLQVWEWPEGFRHYVADHSIRPSSDFERFVRYSFEAKV